MILNEGDDIRVIDLLSYFFLFMSMCVIVGCEDSGESDNGREEVLHPYNGPSIKGVGNETLNGRVMCGYQGWFNAPGDRAGKGWTHYEKRGRFEPGFCTIDLWPDVRDLDEGEKYATSFRHADGRAAEVFSSYNRKSVLRHFYWMQKYGIDGAFVQRFAVATYSQPDLRHVDTVLSSCREGANRYGRLYALMYDLSGLHRGQIEHVKSDWKRLIDEMWLTRDPNDKAYLHHQLKPVVAIWGIGFNDNRAYTLHECLELVNFFKSDTQYGGCIVMVGVPSGWRTLDWESVSDPSLHDIINAADIISPWTVGRYNSLAGISCHARTRWRPDMSWCASHGKDYLPVVFPGFSRHNTFPESPLNAIPRLTGRFLWRQIVEARRSGAAMIYVAMFDEMDEGTAIFKCTNDQPIGSSPFLTYEGLPTDHYLWLTGIAGRAIRGEIPASDEMPSR